MNLNAFFDRLIADVPEDEDALRERIERAGAAQVQAETLRRLESGELPPMVAVSVLAFADLEAVTPDLLRLFRAKRTPDTVRVALALLLTKAGVDFGPELDAMDPDIAKAMLGEMDAHKVRVVLAMQAGTPFEALMSADPEYPEHVETIVDEVVRTFLASPEAAVLPDPEEGGWWIGQFVNYAFDYGLGPPVTLLAEDIVEILGEILPRKVTIESKEDATLAIPAFRAFFEWADRVTATRDTERILELLAQLEPEFPSMMMDERRFGMAKSFLMAGRTAGFDMDTQEGLDAFTLEWNRAHPPSLPMPGTAPRKEDKTAQKRKKKMEKASRRKNRRRK